MSPHRGPLGCRILKNCINTGLIVLRLISKVSKTGYRSLLVRGYTDSTQVEMLWIWNAAFRPPCTCLIGKLVYDTKRIGLVPTKCLQETLTEGPQHQRCNLESPRRRRFRHTHTQLMDGCQPSFYILDEALITMHNQKLKGNDDAVENTWALNFNKIRCCYIFNSRISYS